MKLLAAISVHMLTASGVVWAFFSIDALIREDFSRALLWLALAYFVDMIDGSLARLARVKDVLPEFDGALLDNIIDYITYVLIPALFIYKADMLPTVTALPMAALICLVSTYQFCQVEAKTDDHYFTGFPSYWNVAVLYFFLLKMDPVINLALLLLLVVLVFVPIHYIYPSRTREFQKLNLITAVLWGLSMVAILWQLPRVNQTLLYASLLYLPYYFGISIYLTARRAGRSSSSSSS